ncbi:MAG: ABC transporter permease [Wujia sp.]
MIAFLKKEWMENTRTGRIWILLILFGLFGVMNPAIAKLTPWMMDVLSESLESQGFVVTEVNVTAFDSWVQYYKNIPFALFVMVLMCSQIFTGEYQKGTLIPVVTKGLSRRKIFFAKLAMLLGLWTVCYAVYYGITYAYNAYFWDNRVVSYPLFAAFCYWLFGVWVLSLMLLFSASLSSNIQVLLGTGSVVLMTYLLGLIPKLKAVVPTRLMTGMEILQGAAEPADCYAGIVVTGVIAVACIVIAIVSFNKKQL